MAGTTGGAIPLHTTAKQTRVAAQTPVKTTQKAARPSRSDGKPDRKPVVVAAQPQDARWAIDKTYVTKASAGTKAPSYAYNIVRTAPLEVYTAGFSARRRPVRYQSLHRQGREVLAGRPLRNEVGCPASTS
jgi:hypothetical protein